MWIRTKLFLWIIGSIIIFLLLLYYIMSKSKKNIELISFVTGIASIVLAISTIIIGKCYHKANGKVLEHIELLVVILTDELQHRINGLEDIKSSLENFPGNIPETKNMLDKVKKMEDEIMTSPLLALERNRHEEIKIKNYQKKIQHGQRKLNKYKDDLEESPSEKKKIKIQNRTNNREKRIKLVSDKMKQISDK